MSCSDADVKEITGVQTCADFGPFISASECILSGISSCLSMKGVTDECQDQACAWLSAHLYSITSQGGASRSKKRETFENYTVEYAMSQVQGQGALSTSYGQTANLLTQGCLQESYKAPSMVCFFG